MHPADHHRVDGPAQTEGKTMDYEPNTLTYGSFMTNLGCGYGTETVFPPITTKSRQEAINTMVRLEYSRESATRFTQFALTSPVYPEMGPIKSVSYSLATGYWTLIRR